MKFARTLSLTAAALALGATTATSATSAATASSAAIAAAPGTSAVVEDKRGDVELKKDGWNKGIDIERVRYAKSGDNLKTVIKVRDLNATTTDPSLVFYSVEIYIAGQVEYFFSSQPNVAPYVTRVEDAKNIACAEAKTVLGVAKDLVRIAVPLKCFENPKRISVAANSVQFVGDDGEILAARDESPHAQVINVG